MKYFLLLLSALCAWPCWAENQSSASAPFTWETATPASQGISSAKLDALKTNVANKKTRAFLVIRNDKIVCEWYAAGQAMETKQGTASLAKALVGGMSLGVAITDGRIGLDDAAAKFIPQWKADPRKAQITIRQLGSHTSGLDDAEADGLAHDKLSGWKGEFWKQSVPPNDPFTLARDQALTIFPPGEKLQYSNPGIGMMTYAVTASLRDTPCKEIRTLLRDRVMRPIGVRDEEWTIGYGKTYDVDGLPLVATWGGGSFTPRATARIGRLVLHEGEWGGQKILSKEAVRQVTTDAGLPGGCGMGWWTNAGGRYSKLPKDAVWGAGAGDQLLLVIPGLKLIMVRNGQTLEPGPDEPPIRQDNVLTKYHDYRARILFEPLVAAVEAIPSSPVIKQVTWAPAETIVRSAKGSDNWPMTWADDNLLYTAYGDGTGFEPFVPEKLSLGLASIDGSAEHFTGTNLRAESIETIGHGQSGTKASGLLCVDNVLYLCLRNAGNSQIAWSKDHGKTWGRADWKFTTSFGCPTFLNFGQNYADARDEFVYIYSPDANNAYDPADRMVLARVPKDKFPQQYAYEFFAGLDEMQQPLWTTEIAKRSAVFSHPGRCYRSGITYNAGLKRYLWVQILPGTQGAKTDTRFEGGFAIYDAPEPWGPWTTAFSTEKWDVAPGETASFPTKWISADGRTLYFVFSGEDSFSVRKATLFCSE